MLTIDFSTIPTLTTERLVLRELTAADVGDFFVLRADAALMRYIPRPLAQTPADAMLVIERMKNGALNHQLINWAICLRETPDRVIGTMGYVQVDAANHRAEIGYMLHPDFHRKGLIKEALTAAVQYGIDVYGFHRIEAIVHPENAASAQLLLAVGFEKEGYLRHFQYFNGNYIDSLLFSYIAPAPH